MNKFICISFLLLLTLSSVSAYDFSFEFPAQRYAKPYQNELIQLEGRLIAASDNTCDIVCNYQTSAGPGIVSPTGQGNPARLSKGMPAEFPFSIRADGSGGTATTPITISCDAITEGLCIFPQNPGAKTYQGISIQYSYGGDGVCDIGHEDCASASIEPACACSRDTTCHPSTPSGQEDQRGCAPFCGNGVVERQYENCNNCPGDVGKCDGEYCTSTRDCEGRFCVHTKCSHAPYINGDSYCDNNAGENCRNSVQDCGCSATQQCNSAGRCETFCGNNVCEPGEEHVCPQDCPGYCGDSRCDKDKETCGSCPQDCGVCQKASKEEELAKNVAAEQGRQAQAEKTNQERIAKIKGTLTRPPVLLAIVGGIGIIVWLIIHLRKRKHKKGEKAVAHRKCHKCQGKVEADSKFCHHCGAKT